MFLHCTYTRIYHLHVVHHLYWNTYQTSSQPSSKFVFSFFIVGISVVKNVLKAYSLNRILRCWIENAKICWIRRVFWQLPFSTVAAAQRHCFPNVRFKTIMFSKWFINQIVFCSNVYRQSIRIYSKKKLLGNGIF